MARRTQMTLRALALLGLAAILPTARADGPHRDTLTGRDALGDWTTDAPGVRRKLSLADLPKPGETPSARNNPKVVPRPEGAWPKAPEGFKVTEFAKGLRMPRVIMTAPNGDTFVAESGGGQVRVFRDADSDGKPEVNQV